MRGEYLAGYRVRVGDDGHSLHLSDGDTHEEHKSPTPPSEGGGDVAVVPRRYLVLSFSIYVFDRLLTAVEQ